MKQDVLGLDIGGVVASRIDRFGNRIRLSKTPLVNRRMMPGFRNVCDNLNHHFGGRIYLVSRGDDWQIENALEWLALENMNAIIPESNWNFCNHISDKAQISHALNITHFVDDRLDVLQLLPATVRVRILFDEFSKIPGSPIIHEEPIIIRVNSMPEMLKVLLPTTGI